MHWADRFEQADNGVWTPQARGLAVGQMLSATVARPSGQTGAFGIRFRPGGAYALLNLPQRELANRIAPLDVVPAAEQLVERLGNAPDDAARVDLATSWLLRRRAEHRAPHWAERAVGRLVSTRGRVRIDALTAELAVSGRQLARVFRERVGIGPKALARVLRFQAAWRALERPGAQAATVAAAAGYYDQAHMLREFRDLAGTTPSRVGERAVPGPG